MKMSQNKSGLKLLPEYFRKIGLLVLIFATIPVILHVSLDSELINQHKKIWKIVSFDGLILGLFLIAFSREKIEDEMLAQIRLSAMAAAFIFSIINVFIKPFIDLLFKDAMTDYTGQQIILNMLFYYLMTYYFLKLRR